MLGNQIENPPFRIIIDINPLLEEERYEAFVKGYLIPFMDQLKVPYISVDYE